MSFELWVVVSKSGEPVLDVHGLPWVSFDKTVVEGWVNPAEGEAVRGAILTIKDPAKEFKGEE